ncbi:hypothetical protein C0995_002532 [Termitomyces sp. Mi166|nr:hypothetical protein C0995_002532 [Termitomyces sp. Mi166\
MSLSNIWATTLRIRILERGKALTTVGRFSWNPSLHPYTKLMKDDHLLKCVSHSVVRKAYKEIDRGEFQKSLRSRQLERVHGDESLFGGRFCVGVGFERLPEGGGYRRVIALYTGDELARDNLIAKAQFGDPFTQDPKNVEMPGLELKLRGIEEIDLETLLENPEKK